MTHFDSHAARPFLMPSASSSYLSNLRPWLKPTRLINPDDHANHRVLLGLAALTLPTLAYSMVQLWNVISGGTLQHAIRAFAP